MHSLLFIVIMVLLNTPPAHAGTLGDVTGNGIVGLSEAVHALQVTAGIKHTFATANEITIASGFVEITNYETDNDKTLLIVPSDKTFILTDIASVQTSNVNYNHQAFSIMVNNERKIGLRFFHYSNDENPKSLHFNSGIPFAPGSNIIIHATSYSIAIIISGYFIQNVIASSADK